MCDIFDHQTKTKPHDYEQENYKPTEQDYCFVYYDFGRHNLFTDCRCSAAEEQNE